MNIELDIFQFVVGRLAYARPLAEFITLPGWKHLVGRIWWRL